MTVAKEIKVSSLDFEERKVIGFSVSYGFTSGSIGNVEWELERGEYDDYMSIGDSIDDRIDSGDGWQLSYKRYSSI